LSEYKIPGLHRINEIIFLLNKPIIGKSGLHYQKLLRDWTLIVGQKISNLTVPVKISTIRKQVKPLNTLTIATNSSAAAAELIYHLNVMKEQINFYFGYHFIDQIKIVQSTFENKAKNNNLIPINLSQKQQEKVTELLEEYGEDDQIKETLKAMAQTLVAKQKH
jgi:hypothetical protein